MDDRRQRRAAVRLAVSINRKAAALTADVSNQGFCLETPTLLAPGSAVSGYVLHGNKELTWSGIVSWAEPGNPMLSTWHRVGVKFTNVSAGLRALLSIHQRASQTRD